MIPRKICLHTIVPAALDHIWVKKDAFSVCVLLCYMDQYPLKYFSRAQGFGPFFDRKKG